MMASRFWSKVDTSGACWLWTAAKTSGGYGTFKVAGRQVLAHRIMYEWAFGSIPDGLPLDHVCRVRHCVNPRHLEPVTTRENVLRGEGITSRNAVKTHCVAGHEFTVANTYTPPKRPNCRECRKCRAAAVRRHLIREKVS